VQKREKAAGELEEAMPPSGPAAMSQPAGPPPTIASQVRRTKGWIGMCSRADGLWYRAGVIWW
jgi:hypothetical protein